MRLRDVVGMSRPVSQKWLASVLLPEENAPAAISECTYILSPDVLVRLVDVGEGGEPVELRKMKMIVRHFPTAPCTVRKAKAMVGNLWRRMRGEIPKTFGAGLTRNRWAVKVRLSTSPVRSLFFELTVNYCASGSTNTLIRVPDDVLVHNLPGFLAPADIIRFAISSRKMQNILLTSSYCLNTVLSHARQNVSTRISRLSQRVDIARHRLRNRILNLGQHAEDNEWSALRGAVASWAPASSSISPGVLQCVVVLFALCEIDHGRRFQGSLGRQRLADGVQMLAVATKDSVQTSRLVNLLLRHGDAWIRCLQEPPSGVDPAPPPAILDESRVPLRESRRSSEEASLSERLRSLFPIGGAVSRMFSKVARDPTFLCVDSAPLQRLSRRLRDICVACQHVCESEAPRTRAAAGIAQLLSAERRIIRWFELGGCVTEVPHYSNVCLSALADFGKVGWPRMDIQLAMAILSEVHKAYQVL